MKGYIFDLDGTLLDSMSLWDTIGADYLESQGIAAPSDYLEKITPMSFPESAAYTIERFGLPLCPESLMREWNDMAAYAYESTIEMKPHAKEYLLALHERGVKLAVATVLPARLYKPALISHGIYDLFDTICGAEEVSCSKERPDVFLLCARQLGLKPWECVVFEDILQAVKSAKSVGMTVIGVYDKSSDSDWEQIKQLADSAILNFKAAPL